MNKLPEQSKVNYIIKENSFPNDEINSREIIESETNIPSPYGTTEIKTWSFDGVKMGFTGYRFNDYYSFRKVNELNVVNLEFNLNGRYVIRHLGKEYNVNKGEHNIIYTPGADNTFMNKSLQGETFYIQFSPETFIRITENGNDTLKKFSSEIQSGKPIVLAHNSLSINLEIHRAINDVLNCRFKGRMKRLFMWSKSIEILVLQAEAYHRTSSSYNNYCKNERDKERIYFARDYILNNIKNPPSLPELSRIAGINEYKLKRGFKEIFNSTVFGYLADQRMELGRQALMDKDKTVSEISYELGYSSPQHFSNSFKKKFGISPKFARK